MQASANRAAAQVAVAGLAALVSLTAACARNPVTGRPEPVLTSEQREIELGNEAAKQVEEQIGYLDDEALQAYVAQLGQRLARQSPRTGLEHHFHIVRMREPNAFALPGGHVYVSRGLIALVNSEDELATVLGHEIGHVAARHSVSRQAANVPLAPVRILAGLGGAAASIVSPSIGRIVSGVGQLPGALALAAYSREQEREADRLGQQFAAAEGFDPMALSTFMDALAREEEYAGDDPNRRSFLRSHPRSPERARAAVDYANELEVAKTATPPLSRADFLAHLDGLPVGVAASEGVFVDERFLHPELGFALTFPEDWEQVNSPQAVAAVQPEQLGQVVVQIVDEGSDPMESALAFDREVRLDELPKRLEISGLPAAQAEAEVGGRGDRMRVLITWIAHRDRIYQISGASTKRHFQALRSKFVEAADSFHEITDTERAEVMQDRLRVTNVQEGEDLAALGERTANRWSVEETAIANGIGAEDALERGMLVKVAIAEPYFAEPYVASPSAVEDGSHEAEDRE